MESIAISIQEIRILKVMSIRSWKEGDVHCLQLLVQRESLRTWVRDLGR